MKQATEDSRSGHGVEIWIDFQLIQYTAGQAAKCHVRGLKVVVKMALWCKQNCKYIVFWSTLDFSQSDVAFIFFHFHELDRRYFGSESSALFFHVPC